MILIFSILTTATEGAALILDKVHYENGWNILWTFLSYLTPYSICYCYYLKLKKLKILNF